MSFVFARYVSMSHRESATREAESGFVYLIKSGRFYKIGKSNASRTQRDTKDSSERDPSRY